MINGPEMREQLAFRVSRLSLPKGFLLGSATSAYQVEGGADADGKGESIWDRFSHRPGAICDGRHGDVSSDHYHHVTQDIALMRELGLKAYRFSLSWPRLMPEGSGQLNRRGVAFYDRLVDGLLEAGIEPSAVLHHFDLPQVLQVKGGWYSRDTSMRFADYAATAAGLFGDRIGRWVTLADPRSLAWCGHATAEHAPGLADGVKGALAASHHALLAHGLATPLIRAEARSAEVGILLQVDPVEPVTDRDEDIEAARRYDGAFHRWYLEALFKGAYPEDMMDHYGARLLPRIEQEDMAAISTPLDFLGLSTRGRALVRAGKDPPLLNAERLEETGAGGDASSLKTLLLSLHQHYAPAAIHVTGYGRADPQESADRHGRIEDLERAAGHVDTIEGISAAVSQGVPVKAYFAAPLLDGFEWANGYTTPSGLVRVDFSSRQRQMKWSAMLYGRLAREAVEG